MTKYHKCTKNFFKSNDNSFESVLTLLKYSLDSCSPGRNLIFLDEYRLYIIEHNILQNSGNVVDVM
jgi:hypothetical protein